MPSTDEKEPKRRRGSREETEQRMLSVALETIRRDGVLAGINLADVADEAEVNRGLIYAYFGSRQQLLRAAIERSGWEAQGPEEFARRFGDLPFVERRLAVFRDSLAISDHFKLLAMLILDNDLEARLFPAIETNLGHLNRDVARGDLPEDSDPLISHVMTAMLYLGYGIFREHAAQELKIDLEELDKRALAVVERMVRGIAEHTSQPAAEPTET